MQEIRAAVLLIDATRVAPISKVWIDIDETHIVSMLQSIVMDVPVDYHPLFIPGISIELSSISATSDIIQLRNGDCYRVYTNGPSLSIPLSYGVQLDDACSDQVRFLEADVVGPRQDDDEDR